MTKYRPGPWYIKTNPIPEINGRLWGWVDANPTGEPDKSIAGVDVTWTQGQKSEANARLIAAAPDLLEALQKIVAESDADEWNGVSTSKARAAIAKATGGDDMSDKPEALRLADALEQGKYLLSVERDATAAELRRLHDAVDKYRWQVIDTCARAEMAEARRDELLEALNALLRNPSGCAFCDFGRPRTSVLTGKLCAHDDHCGFVLARAAIAKATGGAA